MQMPVARVHSLGSFSPGRASNSIFKLLCSCTLEGRWSQPGTHRSLSPPLAQLFLPPGGARPQMCANESFSLFTGFGMLWQTVTSLHSPKTGGTQTWRLWMATALTPRYLSGAPYLIRLEKTWIPVRKTFSNSAVFPIRWWSSGIASKHCWEGRRRGGGEE